MPSETFGPLHSIISCIASARSHHGVCTSTISKHGQGSAGLPGEMAKGWQHARNGMNC